jgi:hypothetical protein
MSGLGILLVLLCAGLFFLTALVSWWRTRRHRLFLVELTGLAAALGALQLLFDFSSPIVRFGPSDRVVVMMTFMAVLAGIGSQYFFDLWSQPHPRPAFDLQGFLKPFLISPIVFLPVLGLIPDEVDGSGRREMFLCLNAFQNGFFWRVVYERIQHQLRG